MAGNISNLFIIYLIYPIIGLIMIVVATLIAKKNGLLKNKRLIAYTLLSVLILAAPALLGFLDYGFMPYAYIILSGFYLFTGWYNCKLLPWVFKKEIKYREQLTFIVFQIILSMLFFILVFNLCNELRYGFWASTSLLSFVLVSLLSQTHKLFIRIPALIYKIWNYNLASGYSEPDNIDHNRLKVVTVELFKLETDTKPVRINAKVPEDMLLGDWIKLLFEDYNKKSPHTPIDVSGSEDHGWIFYARSWVLAPRRYLDYELTVKENKIKERHLVIAKRVKNE